MVLRTGRVPWAQRYSEAAEKLGSMSRVCDQLVRWEIAGSRYASLGTWGQQARVAFC